MHPLYPGETSKREQPRTPSSGRWVEDKRNTSRRAFVERDPSRWTIIISSEIISQFGISLSGTIIQQFSPCSGMLCLSTPCCCYFIYYYSRFPISQSILPWRCLARTRCCHCKCIVQLLCAITSLLLNHCWFYRKKHYFSLFWKKERGEKNNSMKLQFSKPRSIKYDNNNKL